MKLDRSAPPTAPDWRIGKRLSEVLAYDALEGLAPDLREAARWTTVTAVSYSPKRRKYQLAVRLRSGHGTTMHLDQRAVLREPGVGSDR